MPETSKKISVDGIAWALVLFALVLVFQQIDADALWWDLARGRAVAGGTLTPSAVMLAGDMQAESDWLGGYPWFLIYRLLGTHGLALGRGLSVVGLIVFLWRQTIGGFTRWRATLTVVSAMIATLPEIGPTSGLWDCFFGFLLFASVRPSPPSAVPGSNTIWWHLRSRLAIQCGLAILWANLGPRSVLSLAAVTGPGSFLAIIGGLCITPRGVLGILDSLQILLPAGSVLLREQAHPNWLFGYAIAGQLPSLLQYAGWVTLTILAIPGTRSAGTRSAVTQQFTGWIVFQFLILTNPTSLPALVPGMWHLAVRQGIFPENPHAASPSNQLPRRWQRLAVPGILLLTWIHASGPSGITPTRLGWGISPRLEVRQVEAALAQRPETGTVFCFDTRAVGMTAWALRDLPWQRPRQARPLQLWTTPQRALLTGNFAHEAKLAADLRTGLDMQHAVSDGAQAGWWQPFLIRETQVAVIPANDYETLRQLEPTRYKPLVLDAPVLPYGLAGDPYLSPGIVRMLADRELVEWGSWVFGPVTPAHSDQSIDLWGILVGRPDPRWLRNQAKVFLAMGLPRAALKIAIPVNRTGMKGFMPIISDATQQIAESERIEFGQPTPFRTAVLLLAGEPLAPRSQLRQAITKIDADMLAPWSEIAKIYLIAGPVAAAKSLGSSRLQDDWTEASLWLEAGHLREARDCLSRLGNCPNKSMRAAAESFLERLPVRGGNE